MRPNFQKGPKPEAQPQPSLPETNPSGKPFWQATQDLERGAVFSNINYETHSITRNVVRITPIQNLQWSDSLEGMKATQSAKKEPTTVVCSFLSHMPQKKNRGSKRIFFQCLEPHPKRFFAPWMAFWSQLPLDARQVNSINIILIK
jgi:hypothetical protein